MGDSNVVLTGGSENMSQAPYALRGTRHTGTKLGQDLLVRISCNLRVVDFCCKNKKRLGILFATM